MSTEQKLQAKIDFLMEEIRYRDNGNAAITFRQRLAYQCYYEKNGEFLYERLSDNLTWTPNTYDQEDIVFNCFTCKTPVIRDSETHDHSECDPNAEDNWYCPECPVPESEDEEEDEEEDEDEDHDICGMTGREFDRANPVKGCGVTIGEDDENIMIGNISFCEACAESETEFFRTYFPNIQ